MFSRGPGRRMPVPEKCAVNPATRTKEKCGRRERDEYSRIDVDFSRGADDKYCRSGIRRAFARVYEIVRQREIDSHAPPPSLPPSFPESTQILGATLQPLRVTLDVNLLA